MPPRLRQLIFKICPITYKDIPESVRVELYDDMGTDDVPDNIREDIEQTYVGDYQCDCMEYYECALCDEKERKIDDLDTEIENLTNEIVELEQQIEDLTEQIAEDAPKLHGHIKEQIDHLWRCLALESKRAN